MYPKSESEVHLWVQVGNQPTLHISRIQKCNNTYRG